MDFETLFFLVGFPLVYVAGILTHKYVLSESMKIMAHITAEVEEVRADVAGLVAKVAAKL
jgi:hypothetical protein